jgi:hypothetical protein
MAALALVLGFLTYMVLVTLLNGVVLVDLWQWFIVPIFHIAPLNIPQALGISLMVGFMAHQISRQKDTEDNRVVLFTAVLRTLSAWGFGWVIMKFL